MSMRRDNNLSNKDSSPAHTVLHVSTTVHFDPYQGKFPKAKLIEWLNSLPDDAKITFTGLAQGKPHFEATWKEDR